MTRGWDKGNSWARWEGSIWQSGELGGVWGLGWVSATDKPQVKFYKKLCTVWAEFQGLSVCVGRKVPSVRASTSRDACHVLAWARRTLGRNASWRDIEQFWWVRTYSPPCSVWWLGLHVKRRETSLGGDIFHTAGLKYKPLFCSLPYSLFIFLFYVSTVAMHLALTGSA